MDDIYYGIDDYFKGKISEQKLINIFKDLLGERIALRLFPFFIASIQNDKTKRELDREYYQNLLKLRRKVSLTKQNCF